MQNQEYDTEGLKQQLIELLSFNVLCKNDFLLKKFDKQQFGLQTYWLARENSIRKFIQKDLEPNKAILAQTLLKNNNQYWSYDGTYDLVYPIFRQSRRQIQILIPKSSLEQFLKFFAEFEFKQEFNPKQQDYKPNPLLTKYYLILENEETAQIAFRKILETKGNFLIEKVLMEDVPLNLYFQERVIERQSQVKKYKHYHNMQYEEELIRQSLQKFQQFDTHNRFQPQQDNFWGGSNYNINQFIKFERQQSQHQEVRQESESNKENSFERNQQYRNKQYKKHQAEKPFYRNQQNQLENDIQEYTGFNKKYSYYNRNQRTEQQPEQE
ncbi:hypothetical protein pb186bvf_006612 [Paramecium bursaria]